VTATRCKALSGKVVKFGINNQVQGLVFLKEVKGMFADGL